MGTALQPWKQQNLCELGCLPKECSRDGSSCSRAVSTPTANPIFKTRLVEFTVQAWMMELVLFMLHSINLFFSAPVGLVLRLSLLFAHLALCHFFHGVLLLLAASVVFSTCKKSVAFYRYEKKHTNCVSIALTLQLLMETRFHLLQSHPMERFEHVFA